LALALSFVGLPLAGMSWPQTAVAAGTNVGGRVVDVKGNAIEGALVIVRCDCLPKDIEKMTNKGGKWRIVGLSPGRYQMEVVYGQSRSAKSFTITPGQAVVGIDVKLTKTGTTRILEVKTSEEDDKTNPGPVWDYKTEDVEDIPTNGGRDNGLGVITVGSDVNEGAGGPRGMGGQSAEMRYQIDGQTASNPIFNQATAGVVQEFIESVQLREGGYDPEFGGVTTGFVTARRAGGSNRFGAYARFTFSPRILAPRTITTTDEALRVTQVPDYQITSALGVSGPIIKDRLFFNLGLAPRTTQFTLTQEFHHRVDRDGSGGFEECPFENGDNDCAAGTNYISTRKFGEQKFRTGASGVGWQAVVDWFVTDKHRLRFSSGGGPTLVRTTYRLPFAFDPSAFGTNPSTDPLSGTSRIANGLVNGKFGHDLANSALVGIEYKGRFAKDTLEVDAGLNYGRWRSINAWRLDDPQLKNIPTTQEQDQQGANLFEFLDREKGLSKVPGVEQACNSSELPGLACPIRTWRSGGIGQYGDVTAERFGGNLSLTHFVKNHQIKYGTQLEHVRQRSRYRYSGSNDADFYENCPAGTQDLGEVCWDPSAKDYVFQGGSRVDNHRFIITDTDNPENRFSVGYGRPRVEQGDLRTIGNSIGAGARFGEYDQTLSMENYAAYVQDRWAILPNLYLSGGVRWDIQDMKDALGRRAILIWDNVAPRIGASYDWSGEGKTRLFGSYGWFYQNLPLQLNNRVFGGLSSIVRQYRNSDCEGVVTTQGGKDHQRFRDGQPTEWCGDTPISTSGLTRGVVVPRLKGMYNQQIQMGYEHEIVEDLVLGVRWLHNDLGRAVEDVSTNGGLNYVIANPGEAVAPQDIQIQQQYCDDLEGELESLEATDPGGDANSGVARELQQCRFTVDAYEKVGRLFDKPTRNYDAFTFRLNKRFGRNWILVASYTYSRLVGNYDGFVDPVSGAVNLGSSRQYDTPELVRNSYGPLSSDQPHRVKVDGAYTFDLKSAGALTLGSSFRFFSGYPINVRADNNRFPSEYGIYVLPRGSGGRVPPNYQWNVSLSYSYALPKDVMLMAEARLLNVTNARAALRVDEVYSYSFGRSIPGGDLSDLKHAKIQSSSRPSDFYERTILPAQGNYGVQTQFQQPLSAQFTLSLRY
jgi:hypothetical protein